MEKELYIIKQALAILLEQLDCNCEYDQEDGCNNLIYRCERCNILNRLQPIASDEGAGMCESLKGMRPDKQYQWKQLIDKAERLRKRKEKRDEQSRQVQQGKDRPNPTTD